MTIEAELFKLVNRGSRIFSDGVGGAEGAAFASADAAPETGREAFFSFALTGRASFAFWTPGLALDRHPMCVPSSSVRSFRFRAPRVFFSSCAVCVGAGAVAEGAATPLGIPACPFTYWRGVGKPITGAYLWRALPDVVQSLPVQVQRPNRAFKAMVERMTEFSYRLSRGLLPGRDRSGRDGLHSNVRLAVLELRQL